MSVELAISCPDIRVSVDGVFDDDSPTVTFRVKCNVCQRILVNRPVDVSKVAGEEIAGLGDADLQQTLAHLKQTHGIYGLRR